MIDSTKKPINLNFMLNKDPYFRNIPNYCIKIGIKSDPCPKIT
jgi:hypothetical protein